MTNQALKLAIKSDCSFVDATAESERYVELIITGTDAPPQSERPPLNLAVVIDRSGSMSGEKLRYVKEAAVHVLEQLSDRDRAAVIAYDDEIMMVSPSRPVTAETRRELISRIREIHEGGSTNLSGGWLRGASEVAERLMESGVNRALLLTDGLANVGITDQDELCRHARELSQRGVSTSTFGVGLDFNERLLSRMAEHGGGHFYYIEHPRQIPDVFRNELGELLTVVARDARLEIQLPEGIRAALLGDMLHDSGPGRITIPIGEICAGQERCFYLKGHVRSGHAGLREEIRAEVRWAGDGSARSKAVFIYAPEEDVAGAARDRGVQERAAEVEIAARAAEALVMERSGDRYGAAKYLRCSLDTVGSALSPAACAPMQELAEQMSVGLTESRRKSEHAKSYSTRQSRR